MARTNARQWMRVAAPSKPGDDEKRRITTVCEAFIRDVIKPRFLPAVVPTQFNYVVDIRGAWNGGRYRFIQRYRSGFPENLGEEFDSPFTRLDRMGPNRFDVQFMRHTGAWFPLLTGLTLDEALCAIEETTLLQPQI